MLRAPARFSVGREAASQVPSPLWKRPYVWGVFLNGVLLFGAKEVKAACGPAKWLKQATLQVTALTLEPQRRDGAKTVPSSASLRSRMQFSLKRATGPTSLFQATALPASCLVPILRKKQVSPLPPRSLPWPDTEARRLKI